MSLPVAFIENISIAHLLLVLIVILILFGGNKLPELARSLGRSLGEFKKGKEEGDRLAKDAVKDVIDDIKKEHPEKIEGPKV